jgi:predicted nucleic acid-binding protein
MTTVFADTSFFLASLNPDDQLHERAITVSREVIATRLTTGFVLLEVGNAMSRAMLRPRFVEFYTWLGRHPHVRVVPVSEELFHRGYELYAAREDKDWSLTDCISFIVMRNEELQAALTHDQHFEQAGYKALLR